MTAREYAIMCHGLTNHKYGDKPYDYHLDMVARYALKYEHLMDVKFDHIISAAWCHDLIEDTRQTYNDVVKVIGKDAAEIVYALTNEKGRTRKDRANQKYYNGITKTPGATFVKICDRLANIKHSLDTKSSMYSMYQKEFDSFYGYLNNGQFKEMWDEMRELLNLSSHES